MNVLILGNCQSMPLAAAWTALRPQDNVASYEIHTLVGNDAAVAGALRRVELADIILHHPVSDDYPVEFARNSVLRQLSKPALLCVPMIFFGGLQPDIVYVGSSFDRVRSPMGDYHSRIVLTSFLLGHSPDAALERFGSANVYEEFGFFKEFAHSEAELRRRDVDCDIAGVDVLLRHIFEVPTLFTVNHPMNVITLDIVVSSFRKLGIGFDTVAPSYIPATLAAGPVWPPPQAIHAHYKLGYPTSRFLKTNWKGERVLSHEDFVYESYAAYDQQLHRLLSTSKAADIIGQHGLRTEDVVRSRELAGVGAGARSPGHCFAGRRAPESHLRGVEELAAADPDIASALIDHAVWQSPASHGTLRKVASFYANSGDKVRAEKFFRSCLTGAPADLDVRTDFAKFLFDIGNSSEILSLLEGMVGQEPRDQATWEFIVRWARKINEPALAITAALRCISVQDKERVSYSSLAHALMDARYPNLAISAISIEIHNEPSNPHHYALRGYACASMEQIAAAELDYQRAVELAPEDSAFRTLLDETTEKLRF